MKTSRFEDSVDAISNLAWKLNWYRQSELEGGLLLGRMVRIARDPVLIQQLTKHAADEVRHSQLWSAVITELKLPVVPIQRSFQSFYTAHDGTPSRLVEVLAFTQIFERRVHKRFVAEAADPTTPAAAARAYQAMIEDEKDHLGWVAEWLADHPEGRLQLDRYRKIDAAVAAEILPFEHRIGELPDLVLPSLSASTSQYSH